MNNDPAYPQSIEEWHRGFPGITKRELLTALVIAQADPHVMWSFGEVPAQALVRNAMDMADEIIRQAATR